MFHWICPECGREIAPGVKECPACDPQPAAVQPVEVHLVQHVAESAQVLVPEIVEHDPEARLRDMVGKMRSRAAEPAVQSAAPSQKPARAASGVPIATFLRSPVGTPAMVRVLATPKIPDVAARLEDSTLREPNAVTPSRAPIRGSTQDARLGAMNGGAQALFLKVALPPFSVSGARSGRTPCATEIVSIEEEMADRIQAAPPPKCQVLASVEPDMALPGPRLPHELTTFDGAGISRILKFIPDAPAPSLGSKIPGWVVTSLVTATLLGGALSAVFYTVPGLASPTQRPDPTARFEAPPQSSPIVEVTGVRIVTGSSKGPEIRYLVVNHSGSALAGATVNVTLRLSRAAAGTPPLSRFAFTATGLGAFESREMVSPIQNMVLPGQLPDWRDVRADVEVEQ